MSEYTVIRHPITHRFVCKIDFERDIMLVKDRGQESIIDLAQVRSANNDPGETLQERQGVPERREHVDATGLEGG
jgi:hypothetical protein